MEEDPPVRTRLIHNVNPSHNTVKGERQLTMNASGVVRTKRFPVVTICDQGLPSIPCFSRSFVAVVPRSCQPVPVRSRPDRKVEVDGDGPAAVRFGAPLSSVTLDGCHHERSLPLSSYRTLDLSPLLRRRDARQAQTEGLLAPPRMRHRGDACPHGRHRLTLFAHTLPLCWVSGKWLVALSNWQRADSTLT